MPITGKHLLMRILSPMLRGSAALALILAACGDDNNNKGTIDSGAGSGSAVAFHQVEHLARPGINEALLITTDYLNGYNATAPSFAGVPTDTLNAVVTEAKTTLRALYLGACFLNDGAKQTADSGLHPAGLKCHAIGTALFEADGITQTAASVTASTAY